MKKNVILYHFDCTDGAGSAWAAWKRFGNSADYIPVKHQFPPPKNLKNRDIYLVDFSYPPPVLKELLRTNNRVILIDHHIGSAGLLPLVSGGVFDNNHSGAVLAWKYFHPKKPVPRLLRHIEDRDLYRFKVPGTEKILLALDVKDHNFKKWDPIVRAIENPKTRKQYETKGGYFLEYQQKIVIDLTRKARLVKFEGKTALAVNSPVLVSEIGHALYQIRPPLAIIWYHVGPYVRVSLRSNNNFDVRKIAEKYGGGGHKAAAAFLLKNPKKLPWKYLDG